MQQFVYAATLAATGLICALTNRHDAPKPNLKAAVIHQRAAPDPLIRRGGYLVTTMGCGDCHSPKIMTPQGPVPDPNRLLSGYNSQEPLGAYDKTIVKTGQWVLFNGQNTAFIGPWGVSFAANLTPDATGLSSWSLAQFTKAMRQGKAKGVDNNRLLLPPMPWPNYTQMTDADLKAVFAYLQSLKPVANNVPAPMPPVP